MFIDPSNLIIISEKETDFITEHMSVLSSMSIRSTDIFCG